TMTMSVSTRTANLPLLPGYSVYDPQKLSQPLRQSLTWKKGVPLQAAKGGSLLTEEDHAELSRNERRLQFAGKRHIPPKTFLPEWAVLEKKVLRFSGYFREYIHGPTDGDRVFRFRPVLILYYLSDDAIAVTEPKTP
ncbi:unnamed protein product, partial [Meganyctiphanes norvegica]